MNASQFYITLGSDLDSLDGKHTVFGEVSTQCVGTATHNAKLLSCRQAGFQQLPSHQWPHGRCKLTSRNSPRGS